MFTGIIEEVGTIKQIQKNPASAVITIAADMRIRFWREPKLVTALRSTVCASR